MSVSESIKSLNALVLSPRDIKEDEKKELLATCDRLRAALETPLEVTFRIVFSQFLGTALRLGIDMKLFDAAVKLSENGEEFTNKQLASESGADVVLINRIMRIIAPMGAFEETGPSTFKLTSLSRVYVTGSPLTEGIIHMTSQNQAIASLPAYFEEHGYHSPNDAYNGPFQYGLSTKLHCFDWLKTKPRYQHAFNVVMKFPRPNRTAPWFEFFPVEGKLLSTSSETLIIDIGGGLGHDLVAFNKRFPDIKGKLIVQDLPVVIRSIKDTDLPASITAMSHDFFAPQPVANAKVYYLSHVLHDWPDKQALQILESIREAMSSDSILLINESVMADSGVSLFTAEADLVMMACFSAMERTQDQFKSLLEAAGLELVKLWTPEPGSSTTLLEAVKKS